MTFNLRFLQVRDKPSLFFMKVDSMQTVFVLLRTMKFLCYNFKYFLECTSQMPACPNYCRVSLNIAEIIASFANFCHFYKTIWVVK